LKEALERKYRVLKTLEEAFTDNDLGGIEIGEYLIIEEIGRGGMGVVYLALQQSLRRYVALKVLPFGFSSDSVSIRRFRSEAQLIARFNHPNIVPVYSMGEEKGICYIAMALIPGLSLNKVLQGLRQLPVNKWSAGLVKDIINAHPDFIRLSVDNNRNDKIEPTIFASSRSVWDKPYPPFILTLCAEIADALSYAHSNGICHGDLKPSNIMLTYGGVPMIVDFGLAKDMQSIQSSRSEDFLGTIAYASPEHITRNIISPASEVWSLGVTMYEMFSPTPPFQSGNVGGTVDKILKIDPPLLRMCLKSLPKDAEAIVFKCLEKASENRYARAEQVKEDIDNFLLSKPILAKPVGKLGRLTKVVKRNRWISTLSCAFVIVLMISLFFALSSSIKQYVVEGDHYVTAGKYPEAIQSYESALKILDVPIFSRISKAAVLSGLGDAWAGMGQSEKAISSYKRALQNDVNNVQALAGMGDLYFVEGHYGEAVAWYNKAIILSPEDSDKYYNRGKAYEKQELYREALRDYLKAIQLAPNDRDTMKEISSLLSKMGMNSISDQVAVLREEGFKETEVKAILQFVDH
jgi:serine/threonine protein kinase/cytochrome c-type biogenesis protein CcmH/NrfG